MQETFSSVYKSDGARYCYESVYINEISDYLNVKSNLTEPTAQKVKEAYEEMTIALENPAQSSQMSGWFTFDMVGRSNVKVTLDGQGADEQLAGYLGYVRNYFIDLPVRFLWAEYRFFRKIQNIRVINIYAGVLFNFLKRIISKKAYTGLLRKIFPEEYYIGLNEYLKRSTTTGILINLLHYSDSLSMAHSVESRVPFMDYRLVEYLASIPANYKLHNGWTKYLARIAMSKRLPDKVTWRKDKVGWPQPEDYWFRGELKEWFCQTIESSSFLKQLNLGVDIRKRIDGKENISKLIKLFNLALWHKSFFNEDKPTK